DEIFDGTIAAMRTLLTDGLKDSSVEVLLLCDELLQDVAVNLAKENRFKKEMVFLPYKASMWDSMESVWQAASNDRDHTIAYVVPIPYAELNPDGSAREWHCEAAEFPKYVPVLDYRYIDLEAMHPSVIVIHNAYDNYNLVTSVDAKYYTRNLKICTDLLVYIPYYVVSGDMEPTQGRIPPLLNVDYIIVQSEAVIQYFSPTIPREKFLPLGSPKLDRVISLCKNPPVPPAAWKWKMQGKRVYFYNNTLASMLADPEQFLKKLQYVFACFRGRADVCLIWRPHPLLETTFKGMRPEYFSEFERIRDCYIAEDFGIYDKTPDIEKTIAVSDAYIGNDGTSVISLFEVAGKPVFYLDNRIQCLPEKDDWLGHVNRVWHFLARDWLIAYGNQLWHAPKHDLHFHHACDLSEYGGGGCYGALLELESRLYVCPQNAQDLLVVEHEKIVRRIPLDRNLVRPGAFSGVTYGFADHEDYFFLLPVMYPAVVRYDFRHDKLDYIPCPNDIFVRAVNGETWRGTVFYWRDWMIFGSPVDSRGFAV
ncbi:MAG: hypothetical protein IKR28_10505, partial [Selenomonadaceae bacterium]|nr:hypothetical protein [Selenomonadaceae bacterium]